MGFGDDRGTYFRARYKIAPGKYGTVQDELGRTIKYRTKSEAEKAAKDKEAELRIEARSKAATAQRVGAGRLTVGEYAARWYPAQDLAASTMQNYRNHLETHILPKFGDVQLRDLLRTDVDAWRKEAREAKYADTTFLGWLAVLRVMLSDAVEEGLIDRNPAERRRGRGKRAGRSRHRSPEKVITDPLGALLVAERAAILSGRDDEFVQMVLIFYTGMRWGEVVGLEPQYVRKDHIRIEWQLYQLDDRSFERCPPKDDSYRNLDLPGFLHTLLMGQIERAQPRPCACHGNAYVFRSGQIQPRTKVTRAMVAEDAGVSHSTVSRAQLRPELVSAETRTKVAEAVARVHARYREVLLPHWDRTEFGRAIMAPAATGWYPTRGTADPARPVPVAAEPWPGAVLRGRYSGTDADACWAPIAWGLTRHGLRHSHRTHMEDIGTRKALMDQRMGHDDGSVSSRYAQPTPGMRARLVDGLTEAWEESLAQRRELFPTSPVPVLNELLQGVPDTPSGKILPSFLPIRRGLTAVSA